MAKTTFVIVINILGLIVYGTHPATVPSRLYRYELENVTIEDVLEEIQNVQLNETNAKFYEVEDNVPQVESRVFYRGSQLWKTIVDSEEKVRILAKLRDEKGK
ncbi:hypothetical protein ABEB36_009810 [Hypothenemus hampei]|uniref:Uncharacterized protein n=1 Tax=Hypothenemus hampei TaxID=57062 RepID=A0ABD1EHJ2_HYPHA